MVKIITATEAQFLLDVLEDSFNIAKEAEEMETMIDVAQAIELLNKLKQAPVEDCVS